MSRCWFKEIGLTQKIMCAYCIKHIGVGVRYRTKLSDLVIEALDVAGHKKPAGVSGKRWIADCAHIIKGVAKAQSYKRSASLTFEATDAFLQSYEWRRVRMLAIKKYGAQCQCCGASPKTGAVINVDHIKPRKLFPELSLSLDNLQVLCHECNHGKGNWDMTDWRVTDGEERNA